MDTIIFRNGKSIQVNVKAETNQDRLNTLNDLVSNGYISGFLTLLQKEGKEQ